MIIHLDQERLRALFDRVVASPYTDFYRKKYDAVAIAEPDLEQLPFLYRSELVVTPADERCYVDPQDVRFVGYTSGTTSGKPLIQYFGKVSRYHVEPSLGLYEVNRLLITYPPLNKNFGASFIQQCAEAERPVTPVFADYQNLANSAVVAAATQCNALYATPTIAVQLIPYMEQYATVADVRLVALASEQLTASQEAIIRSAFPNAAIANLYASAEVGQFIAYPCPVLMGAKTTYMHLLTEDVVAAELIDDELVITMDKNPAFPLVRYCTGDRFRIVDTTCSCGRGVVLELLGRENVDSIRVHGFELRADKLDGFLAAQPVQPSNYQFHVYPVSATSAIRVVLEVTGMTTVAAELLQVALFDDFYVADKLSVREAVTKGIVDSVTVTVVEQLSVGGDKRRRIVNHIQ